MPLAFPLVLSACKDEMPVLRLSGQAFGTTFNVVALDPSGKVTDAQAMAAVQDALTTVDAGLSNWRADSEIARFNADTSGAVRPLSSDLAEVMQAAEQVHQASLGRFDTTVGPLIELWGFGAQGTQQRPTDAAIAAERARSGHSTTLQASGAGLRKVNTDAQVYLAGIGKGFGADKVSRALEALGISDYMVEIGGDLYASGTNPEGQPWQIGIEAPNAFDRGVFDVVDLSGLGLATSGDYRNYFEADGTRFSHLIDPTTGYPVTHQTASATVLAENAMLADAWSTAMLILGREQGMEVAKANDIAVQFIERVPTSGQGDYRTTLSPRFEALAA